MDYKKMNPSDREMWLFALRGGKYKQGRGHLRQSNGEDVFCYLGVLQDVIQPEDWVKPHGYSYVGRGQRQDDSKVWSVPEAIIYGGDYDDPSLNDGEIQERLMEETNFDSTAMEKLISLNDGRRPPDDEPELERIDMKTFDEIADWIEENL